MHSPGPLILYCRPEATVPYPKAGSSGRSTTGEIVQPRDVKGQHEGCKRRFSVCTAHDHISQDPRQACDRSFINTSKSTRAEPRFKEVASSSGPHCTHGQLRNRFQALQDDFDNDIDSEMGDDQGDMQANLQSGKIDESVKGGYAE